MRPPRGFLSPRGIPWGLILIFLRFLQLFELLITPLMVGPFSSSKEFPPALLRWVSQGIRADLNPRVCIPEPGKPHGVPGKQAENAFHLGVAVGKGKWDISREPWQEQEPRNGGIQVWGSWNHGLLRAGRDFKVFSCHEQAQIHPPEWGFLQIKILHPKHSARAWVLGWSRQRGQGKPFPALSRDSCPRTMTSLPGLPTNGAEGRIRNSGPQQAQESSSKGFLHGSLSTSEREKGSE